jgi:hypothetical protein
MKKKLFEATQFKASQFSTAEEKAKFANQFVAFVEADFVGSKFPKWFYTRLSMTFGHIAHFNQNGFYQTWFDSTASKLDFLKRTLNYGHGDPQFTYSDVERVLALWVRNSSLIGEYAKRLSQQIEAQERALLAKLKAKYETGNA